MDDDNKMGTGTQQREKLIIAEQCAQHNHRMKKPRPRILFDGKMGEKLESEDSCRKINEW